MEFNKPAKFHDSVLPEGTVTFLFTDIEGSTQLLKQLGSRYKELISEHDRIIQAALARWNGREVDSRGEESFATFLKATEAVAATADMQHAFAKHPWPEGVKVRVRMGLHTGEPWLVEKGYMGMDVHRASRIGNVGHGGQVLLSETTTALVRDELPEGVSLQDLGRHRLKDMRRLEPIHQLVIEGLLSKFPPLKSLEALATLPTDQSELISTGAPRKVGPSPYRGLAAFREDDAPLFFGREIFVSQISKAIGQRQLVAVVVGPSGSGKSSVVFAGLLPQFRHEPKWLIVETRPGSRPFHAIAAALVPHLQKGIGQTELLVESSRLARAMRAGELSLFQVADRALALNAKSERCLLVIDQFEELFTQKTDLEFQRLFLDELIAAASAASSHRPPRLVLLLTMRADFMGQALGHRPFADALQEGSLILGPMNRDELQAAIEKPAHLAGAAFETGLVQRILDDVGAEPGNLPLLEFALTLLWERMEKGWMTHAAYDEIGRVDGALARYAEEVWIALDDDVQARAHSLFVQLVQPGEGTEDTRRVAKRRELVSGLWSLVQHLADRRLVVTGRDDAGEEIVEVVHEALIRSWARLREWMRADRAFRTWQEGLRVAQRDWEASGRDDGALLRGAPLALALEWSAEKESAAGIDESIGPLEKEFIEASHQDNQRREAQREARRQRELETARKLAATERARAEEKSRAAQSLRRRAFILGSVLVLAAVLAVAAFMFARQSSENAQVAEENATLAIAREAEALEQRAIADEQRAAAAAEARAALQAYSQSLAAHVDNALEDRDSATALAIALEANAVDEPPTFAQRMLRQAAYAPGPRRQFQVADIFPEANGRVYSLAMSPRENAALIGFEDGSLYLWDVETQRIIHSLDGHAGHIRSVAFSPDGQTALSGSSDRSMILWDLATGQEIRRFEGHTGWVWSVAFGPGGKTAVSGGFVGDSIAAAVDPGELILWDLESGREIRRFEGLPSGIQAIAFHPEGKMLLASSGFFALSTTEYGLILWDVETGEIVQSFEVDHSNFDLAFSPDGSEFVTGGSDNNLYIWDLETGKRVQTLSGHQSVVTAVAFTPDGNKIVSGDWNSRIIFWDLQTGSQIMQSTVHNNYGGWVADDDPPINLDMIPGQNRAISSAGDGMLVLWDLTNAAEIRRFNGTGDPISAVAFTPDGKSVLTGPGMTDAGAPFPRDPAVRLWDVATGEQVRAFKGDLIATTQIACSPDGKMALFAGLGGIMSLWDLDTGTEIRRFSGYSPAEMVFSVAFTPDGRTGLSGSYSNEGLIVWDLENGDIKRRITTGDNFTSIFTNPDGQTAYVPARGLLLLDLATGLEIRRYSIANCCTGFAIHPSGRTVFTGGFGEDTLIREWDLETDQEIRVLGETEGFRTRLEVSTDGQKLLTSEWNGTLKLWDLESGEEISSFNSESVILDIDMSPDGTMAISPGGDGTAILWDLSLPFEMEEVRTWIQDNRFVRDLGCEERELYRIEPLCEAP